MSDVFNNDESQQGPDLANMSTDELLREIARGQAEHRAEVAALHEKINAQKAPAPAPTGQVKSQEQLLEERVAQIREFSHYCPGCGRLGNYPRECQGHAEAGHPPIEMVSTEELLNGDPSQHTPAPHTDKLG